LISCLKTPTVTPSSQDVAQCSSRKVMQRLTMSGGGSDHGGLPAPGH
jgi:hypothetical protein